MHRPLNPLDHPICLSAPKRLSAASAWNEHVPFAMLLVDLVRPRVLVELGAHSGVSYCAFCQAAAELRLDTQCHAIDTWKGDEQTGLYGPDVLNELRADGINVQEMENVVFAGGEAAVARINVEGALSDDVLAAIKGHEQVLDVQVVALT